MIFNTLLRVTVVESDDLVRQSLGWLLGQCHPATMIAGSFSNTADVIASLPSIRAEVLALAANLPGLVAAEFLARARDALPDVQVLVIAGLDDSQAAVEAIRAGAQACVQKEHLLDELSPALHALLRRELWFSPRAASWVVRATHVEPADQMPPIFQTPALHPKCPLSPRELLVLRARSKHLSYKEIANIHDITPETARWYANSARQKLNAPSVADALRLAVRAGWARPDRDVQG